MKIAFCLVLFSLQIFTSCKKSDLCESVTCLNGGVCFDGNCKCPEGYYGVHCELTSSGYVCTGTDCVFVQEGADYSSYSICIDYCDPNVNTGGFSCFNNNCIFQTENGDYATLTECEANCANSGCSSVPYYGPQPCEADYVAVTPNSCCPRVYPYLGVQKSACYPTCWTALGDNNSTIIFGTGEE